MHIVAIYTRMNNVNTREDKSRLILLHITIGRHCRRRRGRLGRAAPGRRRRRRDQRLAQVRLKAVNRYHLRLAADVHSKALVAAAQDPVRPCIKGLEGRNCAAAANVNK
jgi:hypothetical protein